LALSFCGPGLLAAGGSDNVIRIWDLASGKEQSQLVGHTGSVTTLAWDTKSSTLISGSFDTTIRFWQLKGEGGQRVSRREQAPAGGR
jgi:WD40 repeat protein